MSTCKGNGKGRGVENKTPCLYSSLQVLKKKKLQLTIWIASYLLQSLSGDRVVPALHVLSREFVLAEDSHRLAFFAASDRLDHLVKVGLVAFILRDTGHRRR